MNMSTGGVVAGELMSDIKIDPDRIFCKPTKVHEWRITENLFTEVSRSHRIYGAYCVHCRRSATVEVQINGNN